MRNIDRLSLFKRDKAQTKREGIRRERERGKERRKGEKGRERKEGSGRALGRMDDFVDYENERVVIGVIQRKSWCRERQKR